MADQEVMDDLDQELQSALSAFEGEGGEGREADAESSDNQDEQDDDVVAAPTLDDKDAEPAAQAGAGEPVETEQEAEFYTQEQLAAMPKGAAIPIARFQQLVEQRNRERAEREAAVAEVERLKQAAQAPAWMQQPPSWLESQQQAAKQPDNGLPEWLNPDDLDPATYNAFMWQHQQQQLLQHQMQQAQQQAEQLQRWQQQQQLQAEAQRIQTWAKQVTQELPDVDEDYIYTQLQAGFTPEQAYTKAVQMQSKFTSIRGVSRPTAPAPAPQPARSASGAPSKGTSSGSKKWDLSTEEGRKARLNAMDI